MDDNNPGCSTFCGIDKSKLLYKFSALDAIANEKVLPHSKVENIPLPKLSFIQYRDSALGYNYTPYIDNDSGQPVHRFSAQPGYEFSAEPVYEFSAESVHQFQFRAEPVHQLTAELLEQFRVQFSAKPVRQYSAEPVHQSSAQPVHQSNAEPGHQSSAEPQDVHSAYPQQYSVHPELENISDSEHESSGSPTFNESTVSRSTRQLIHAFFHGNSGVKDELLDRITAHLFSESDDSEDNPENKDLEPDLPITIKKIRNVDLEKEDFFNSDERMDLVESNDPSNKNDSANDIEVLFDGITISDERMDLVETNDSPNKNDLAESSEPSNKNDFVNNNDPSNKNYTIATNNSAKVPLDVITISDDESMDTSKPVQSSAQPMHQSSAEDVHSAYPQQYGVHPEQGYIAELEHEFSGSPRFNKSGKKFRENPNAVVVSIPLDQIRVRPNRGQLLKPKTSKR